MVTSQRSKRLLNVSLPLNESCEKKVPKKRDKPTRSSSSILSSIQEEEQELEHITTMLKFIVQTHILLASDEEVLMNQEPKVTAAAAVSKDKNSKQEEKKADPGKKMTQAVQDQLMLALDRILVCLENKKGEEPKKVYAKLSSSSRNRMCGHTFGSDEIAFSCRTCRTDPSCVMCKQCFTRSNHVGHDVNFQRTTAGGCCDCGEPQAWKPSGFCSRHPGPLLKKSDDGQQSREAIEKLPPGIRTIAPMLIDVVVQFIFETVQCREESFELAQTLHQYYTAVLASLVDAPASTNGSPSTPLEPQDLAALGTTSTRQSTRLIQHRNAAANAVLTPPSSPPSKEFDVDECTQNQYRILLHHDDNHSNYFTSNMIKEVKGCTDYEANTAVAILTNRGECQVRQGLLHTCAPSVSTMLNKKFRMSVSPIWQQQLEKRTEILLNWLYHICAESDGLTALVVESLCKTRDLSSEAPCPIEIPEVLSSSLQMMGLFQKHVDKKTIEYLQQSTTLFSSQMDNARLVTEMTKVKEYFCQKFASKPFLLERERRLKSEASGIDTSSSRNDKKRRRLVKNKQDLSNDETTPVLSQEILSSVTNRLVSCFLLDLGQDLEKNDVDTINGNAANSAYESVLQEACQYSKSTSLTCLELLVRNSNRLQKGLSISSNRLFQELILDMDFKLKLMHAFLLTYEENALALAQGFSTSEDSILDFSVQLFSVPSLVQEHSRTQDATKTNIMDAVLNALFSVLNSALQRNPVESEAGSTSSEYPVILRQARYRHCIDNLEHILSVSGTSKLLLSSPVYFEKWLDILNLMQNEDGQLRRDIFASHVEYELDNWVSMFNLCIRFHSIFHLLSKGLMTETISLPSAQQLPLVMDVDAVENCQSKETSSPMKATSSARLFLPAEEISPICTKILNKLAKELEKSMEVMHVTAFDYIMSSCSTTKSLKYPVAKFMVDRMPVSFHLPLHRYYVATIKRVLWLHDNDIVKHGQPSVIPRRLMNDEESQIWGLSGPDHSNSDRRALFLNQLGFTAEWQHDDTKKMCLIDYPLRCIVMAAQIQANLWRRNGEESMMAQVYNYTTLPFCVQFQDADIFLIQLGIILFNNNADYMLSLMIERFQLSAYFMDCPDTRKIPTNNDNTSDKIPNENATQFGYTSYAGMHMDSPQLLSLLEEFLRFFIVLGTDLPFSVGPQYLEDTIRREVLHQLCAKSLTFSELTDITMIPGGQEEVPAKELERILSLVSDYEPPLGLQPGRYKIKDEAFEEYNPYFSHLSRESHQLARDRWTRHRLKVKLSKRREATKPDDDVILPPVARPQRPISALSEIRNILMTSGAVGIVRTVVYRFLQRDSSSVNDAVLSCALHVLTYGMYIALEHRTTNAHDDSARRFFQRIREDEHRIVTIVLNSSKTSTVSEEKEHLRRPTLLRGLLELSKNQNLVVSEQQETLRWILHQLHTRDVMSRNIARAFHERCTQERRQAEAERKTESQEERSFATDDVEALAKIKKQKQEQARQRAIAAMARNQASFSKLMGEKECIALDRDIETTDPSVVQKDDSDEDLASCILCHDSARQNEIGYVAFLQQSTVLSSAYRPNVTEALHSRGEEQRKRITQVLQKSNFVMPMTYHHSRHHHHHHHSDDDDEEEDEEDDLHEVDFDDEDHFEYDEDHFDDLEDDFHLSVIRSPRNNNAAAAMSLLERPPSQRRRRRRRTTSENEGQAMISTPRLVRSTGANVLTPESVPPTMTMIPSALAHASNTTDSGTGANPVPESSHDRRRTRQHRQRRRRRPRSGSLHSDDSFHSEPMEEVVFPEATSPSSPALSYILDDDDDVMMDDDDGDGDAVSMSSACSSSSSHDDDIEQQHPFIRHTSAKKRKSHPFVMTPSGLHFRTCNHAVHIGCLEKYINSLHEKAERGEEVDGIHAIDIDSAMSQFLCPMCKTLSNTLIPSRYPSVTQKKTKKKKSRKHDDDHECKNWSAIVAQQHCTPTWFRHQFVFPTTTTTTTKDNHNLDTSNRLWAEYFEKTFWEPHHDVSKIIPYLWSTCAFTIASTQMNNVVVVNTCGVNVLSNPNEVLASIQAHQKSLVDVQKEKPSIHLLIEFARHGIQFTTHSKQHEVQVLVELAKRSCPFELSSSSSSSRSQKKLERVLAHLSPETLACLKPIRTGLRDADAFTRFVISASLTEDLDTIESMVPVFYTMDLLYQVVRSFFISTTHDHDDSLWLPVEMEERQAKETVASRRPKRRASASDPPKHHHHDLAHVEHARIVLHTLMAKLEQDDPKLEQDDDDGHRYHHHHHMCHLLLRLIEWFPTQTLIPLTRRLLEIQLELVQSRVSTTLERMCLYLECLDSSNEQQESRRMIVLPTLESLACRDTTSDSELKLALCWTQACETTTTTSDHGHDGLVAKMFQLPTRHDANNTRPQLVQLPEEYEVLYSAYAGSSCAECQKVPSEPGLCLVCGSFLCCATRCCTTRRSSSSSSADEDEDHHYVVMGECTRHALTCGAGVGIVLQILQCRLMIIGGSMAISFACPYVDEHGEEDTGLLRGKPLRLSHARLGVVETLWRSHRLATEVSRQRNQHEPQELLTPGSI